MGVLTCHLGIPTIKQQADTQWHSAVSAGTPQWEPRPATYIFSRFITLQLNPNLLILLQLFNNLCNCLEIAERHHWNRSWVIKSCNSTDWNYPEFKTQTALALWEGKLRLQSRQTCCLSKSSQTSLLHTTVSHSETLPISQWMFQGKTQ